MIRRPVLLTLNESWFSLRGGLGQRAGVGRLVQEGNADECDKTSALRSASLGFAYTYAKPEYDAADHSVASLVNKARRRVSAGVPSRWAHLAVTWIYVCFEA
jgi:hypothetical protein